MKLVSLNVEGPRHEAFVFPFLEKQDPDVICLQEAPFEFVDRLKNLGYYAEFAPRCIKSYEGREYTDGVLTASKIPATFSIHHYYKPTAELQQQAYLPETERNNSHQVFILAEINLSGALYVIGNNHFTWTPEGNRPGIGQRTDMVEFTKIVQVLPPHVMCGDFNIPRHHSSLYESLTALYSDTIPEKYSSSLDKNLHRVGHLPEKQNLFTDYMVDYVFTQPPYSANDVRLEFGISDHAAVLAEIYIA